MQRDLLIAEAGELTGRKDLVAGTDALQRMAEGLILYYNAVHKPEKDRLRAAELVAEIAKHEPNTLSLLYRDAQRYAKNQAISDASPYSPNSFDVLLSLSKDGPGKEQILQFSMECIRSSPGTARWEGIRILAELRDENADSALLRILRGEEPGVIRWREVDRREIERLYGRGF